MQFISSRTSKSAVAHCSNITSKSGHTPIFPLMDACAISKPVAPCQQLYALYIPDRASAPPPNSKSVSTFDSMPKVEVWKANANAELLAITGVSDKAGRDAFAINVLLVNVVIFAMPEDAHSPIASDASPTETRLFDLQHVDIRTLSFKTPPPQPTCFVFICQTRSAHEPPNPCGPASTVALTTTCSHSLI